MEAEKNTELYREYDEEILLHQRDMRNRKKYHTLETGIYIQGKVETFYPAKLFEERLGIMLPESFGIMPEMYQQVKYPSSFRPAVLLSDDDMTVNIGFTRFNQASSEDELEGITDQVRGILKRANPDAQLYEQQTVDTADSRKVWFDFRTQALDEAIYNIQFLTLVKGSVVLGMFNCLYRHKDDWEDAFKQMIESVWDITRQADN